ncbi:MAG: sensor histidine kinase [Planctomycetota bacterium]|jgi:two-component system phosphate regulon sensor histidine kinase PhoR
MAAAAAALIAGGGVAYFAASHQIDGTTSTTMWISFGAGVVVFGLVQLLLFRHEATVLRIREFLRRSAEGEIPDPPPALGIDAGLVHDASRAVDILRSNQDRAATELRELQIRSKITEAERDHAVSILQSLQDAVIVTDIYNDIKMVNRRACDLLRLEPESVVNESIASVVDNDVLRDVFERSLETDAPFTSKSLDVTVESSNPDDPTAHCYDVTLTALPDVQGTLAGVGGTVTILRDVTREREISQMKSEFVSKASHELRTPLSSINAYLEMLLDGEAQTEDSRQEFYQILKNESERLGRMIDNMLNISRIEAGILKSKIDDVDFVQAVNRAVEVITPQAASKNISLKVNAGPLVYSAMADEDMLHQVFLNLLSNAVKYTPEGGRVTITLENDDASGAVMVSVADTGLGIPPDDLGKVFDKFFRIENYKRVARGTGLGLSLVKHIVESIHKGSISVESKLGMGSRFIVSIPYKQQGV